MRFNPHSPSPARRRLATGALGLLLITAAGVARAQSPAAAADGPAAEAVTLPPPRPDASHGLQLQRLVERWLQAGSIEGRRGDPLPAAGVLGVRVTLRSDGHALGTGTAWVRPEVLRPRLAALQNLPGAGAADEPRPADLLALTQEAAVDAFRAAERRLEADAEEARAAGRLPRLRGAAAVASVAEVADQIQADVQIAHAAEPVRAPEAGSPGAGPAERFVPGFHGLLALPGDARAAPVAEWPATALAFNLRPRLQLHRVAQGLGLEMSGYDTPGRPGGPALFRFEVVHAVRPGRGEAVRVLERGNLPLPRGSVDAATLAGLGDRLAEHLAIRYPLAGPVRGTWHPARGRFDPPLADLEDAALGAYALAAHDRAEAERAAATGTPAPPRVSEAVPGWHERVAQALDMPEAEARQRTGSDEAQAPALEPGAAALLTLGRLASRGGEADPVGRRFAAELLARCEGGEVRRRPRPGVEAAAVPLTVQAMAGYALGLHALAAGDDAQTAAAAAVLAGVWARGDAAVVSAGFSLPWLGRAVREVEPALVERGLLEPDEADRRRATLLAVLPQLQEAQIVRRPADGPPDVVGGFLLRPAPEGGVAEPTWSTAPLLQFLAQGLTGFGAGPHAAPGGPGLLITAGSAAGFLAQLTLDGPSLYYARSARNAAGGLRLALDDARLPIGPTAAGLLAVDELERALDELAEAG